MWFNCHLSIDRYLDLVMLTLLWLKWKEPFLHPKNLISLISKTIQQVIWITAFNAIARYQCNQICYVSQTCTQLIRLVSSVVTLRTSSCQSAFLKCAPLPGNELFYFPKWEIEQSCLFALCWLHSIPAYCISSNQGPSTGYIKIFLIQMPSSCPKLHCLNCRP